MMTGSQPSIVNARHVVTTRPSLGDLEDELRSRGYIVTHLALTEIRDVDPAVAPSGGEWLVATSQHGARRAAPWTNRYRQLAAVGSSTAQTLATSAGRPVDLVPSRATATDLVREFPTPPATGGRVTVLVGDQAADTVRIGLSAQGWDVEEVVVYSTVPILPNQSEVKAAVEADVVLIAAGSAARSWMTAARQYNLDSPPVITIGAPSAEVAGSLGLRVVAVAEPPSIEGLIDAVDAYFTTR